MAERLNSIAYNETSLSNHLPSGFNPRSVSFDIRTPAELAAVNDFLLALGRDVSCLTRPALAPSHASNFSTDNYFDPSHLTQLGLTGMPGIPPANSGFTDSAYGSSNTQYSNRGSYCSSTRATQPAIPSQYGNMYDIHDSLNNYSASSDYSRRSNKYSPGSFSTHHHPTPPLENSSPHSTTSTPPVTLTPPLPLSMPDTFDYVRPSRGAPSVTL